MLFNLYQILCEGETIMDGPSLFEHNWIPTNKEWEKMIMYLNEYAHLDKIFRNIKDIDKIVRLYLIAKAIEWPNIYKFYKHTLKDELLRRGLTPNDLLTISETNLNIPEVYQEMINDLEQDDEMGGIATRSYDFGLFRDDNVFINALKKIKDIKNFKFVRCSLLNCIRMLEINFINGSRAYMKVVKVNSTTYHIETKWFHDRNIKSSFLGTKMYMDLIDYAEEYQVDDEKILNEL